MVPILTKIENSMKPMHTKLMKLILASFEMSRYRHRGIVTKKVAIKTMTSRLAKTEVWSIPVTRTTTLVTVSPTTTLYETIATI